MSLPRQLLLLLPTLVLAQLSPSRVVAAEGDESQVVQTPVYVAGENGYHTYRIPSLLVSKKGTLLAFCEGRKTGRGDHGDLDLMLRRSTDGGKTWTQQQVVYEEGGDKKITIGNPCPVVDQSTGRIWMPFCRDNDDVLMTYSDDDGQTWAKPQDITSDVKQADWTWYATGPGVGIQLTRGPHAGRMVIPCDHRGPFQDGDATFSHAFYSDDHGETWKLGETIAPHTNECQVAELQDGTLIMNMRNYWGREGKVADRDKCRAVATSKDGGHSWSKLRFDHTLVEPICQASLISAPPLLDSDGNAVGLLFSNPASKSTRHQLTVRYSYDDGQTWPFSQLLHAGPAAYSNLAILPGGEVGCLYERGEKSAYEQITFARFPLSWVLQKKQ